MYLIYPKCKAQHHKIQWYFDVFSKDECEQIIKTGQCLPVEEATIGEQHKNKNNSYRSASISWIKWDQETDWIFSKFAVIANKANEQYDLSLVGLIEPLQYTEYNEGDFYNWHQDLGDQITSIRKLSMIAILTDPSEYEGGLLEILGIDEPFPLHQGMIYCFQSFEVHRVTKLLSGRRKSLVAWVSGPPYR